MSEESILIADTNPYILDRLPPLLADSFPHLNIDICDSRNRFPDKLRNTPYDTIAMSPLLLLDFRHLQQKRRLQLLTPLLVTASMEHPLLAKTVLETDAFDVIITPIYPIEVVQIVRLALWQSRLLRLLTSRDRPVTLFQQHMAAFPTDWKAEEYYARQMAALDATFKAFQCSMRLLIDREDEEALIDIAASVGQCAKQRALDRLLNLCKHATT